MCLFITNYPFQAKFRRQWSISFHNRSANFVYCCKVQTCAICLRLKCFKCSMENLRLKQSINSRITIHFKFNESIFIASIIRLEMFAKVSINQKNTLYKVKLFKTFELFFLFFSAIVNALNQVKKNTSTIFLQLLFIVMKLNAAATITIYRNFSRIYRK